MTLDPGITAKEMDELCTLAGLYLGPAEKERLIGRLDAVMKVLSKIQEVETAGAGPAVHPAALPVRFREDEVEPSLDPALVFRNTAHRSDSYFRVPRIAGEEPG
ncbi:MAG: Asp-tRNA(Asn)/Glu-tRNA(Gln) amidotransferase subunit GatC [Firmicutes bacterium]|nr:Asp-tRNA(Asn)/Glu-tRNA(Gln) amidotransferase subunit GatC [Bacillota bacterium]